MGTTSGKYVSSISITAGASATGNLALTAVMKTSGVNSAISGGTLILTTADGGKSWSCTGGNIAMKYRPASCRS